MTSGGGNDSGKKCLNQSDLAQDKEKGKKKLKIEGTGIVPTKLTKSLNSENRNLQFLGMGFVELLLGRNDSVR